MEKKERLLNALTRLKQTIIWRALEGAGALLRRRQNVELTVKTENYNEWEVNLIKRIDTERRRPDPENPNRLIYNGQRTAQEIFSELRYRLESTGYLPDEYFILDMDWENGREWPESGDIFCTVDYGGSEGIYLDIYLKYKDEKGKWRTDNLATGKTLGERDEDMDRIYPIFN